MEEEAGGRGGEEMCALEAKVAEMASVEGRCGGMAASKDVAKGVGPEV